MTGAASVRRAGRSEGGGGAKRPGPGCLHPRAIAHFCKRHEETANLRKIRDLPSCGPEVLHTRARRSAHRRRRLSSSAVSWQLAVFRGRRGRRSAARALSGRGTAAGRRPCDVQRSRKCLFCGEGLGIGRSDCGPYRRFWAVGFGRHGGKGWGRRAGAARAPDKALASRLDGEGKRIVARSKPRPCLRRPPSWSSAAA